MKIYKKYNKNGKLIQTAKIVPLPGGRYSFETSLFGVKPYEINMNMPIMNTESEASQWIENSNEWQ